MERSTQEAKIKITNHKIQINSKSKNKGKIYDLEERTFEFSKSILNLCRQLSSNLINKRLSDQLVRSGTSIGANYREANETDTKNDFKNRVHITKKEAKETVYWLKLIKTINPTLGVSCDLLISECTELVKIFASIYEKAQRKRPCF